MDIITDIEQWQRLRDSDAFAQQSIGFVPTMGYLHDGHLSLIKRARAENDKVVSSIFVNPTQFNNSADLEKYPRNVERDCALAKEAGVDVVLMPDYQDLYIDDYRYQVDESELSKILEGEHRPGHFTGMLTVVMKLLMLVKAKHAYFGEKDFQQLDLVKGMTEAFFMDTKVVGCPTIREADGLALSSRNVRLSDEQRQQAAKFPELLAKPITDTELTTRLKDNGFAVDYVDQYQGRRVAAVYLGDVRLIDNVEVK